MNVTYEPNPSLTEMPVVQPSIPPDFGDRPSVHPSIPPGIACIENIVAELASACVFLGRGDQGQVLSVTILHEQASKQARERFTNAASALRDIATEQPIAGVLQVHRIARDGCSFQGDKWWVGSVTDLPALGWDVEQRVQLVRQLCSAMGQLHARGVVHGCLCPSNVLLDDDLNPIMTEVGMADVVDSLDGDRFNVAGYGAYVDPALLAGEPQSVLSDVFSVGRLLFYVLLGEHPAAARERDRGLAKLGRAHPALERIIRSATTADPRARYQSPEELARDLENYASEDIAPSSRLERSAEAPMSRAEPAPPSARGPGSRRGDASPSSGVVVDSAPEERPWAKKPLVRGLAAAGVTLVLWLALDPVAMISHGASRRALSSSSSIDREEAVTKLAELGDRELSGVNLSSTKLGEIDLAGANLRGADLSNAELRGTSLTGADLRGARLSGADLSGADLAEVDLAEVTEPETARCDESTTLPESWNCDEGTLSQSGQESASALD